MVLTSHVPEWGDGDTRRDPLREQQRPTPEPTGPFDVIVRVEAAGVCRTDLHLIDGTMSTSFPRVLGHETAGTVHRIGPLVTTVEPGDRVVCYPFITSGRSSSERAGNDTAAPDRSTPGITTDGGFADYLSTHERSMLKIPEHIDPATVASLTDAGLAAYRAAAKAQPLLTPGTTVMVLGAGGLGHLGIQILTALTPARIIAVDPSEPARQLALDSGAHLAVTPDDTAGHDHTVDVVIDFVGTDSTTNTALRALRFGGALFVVGVGGRLGIELADLVDREQRIEGVFVGTYSDLEQVTDLALRHLVEPRIVRYPLTSANDALRDLAAGRITGRAVLCPDMS